VDFDAEFGVLGRRGIEVGHLGGKYYKSPVEKERVSDVRSPQRSLAI
jgi:hypothetical protein